ncbi:hypothetical protein Poly30_49650 [Planctomycetes bacterium Poly30]|uniref:Uncharacterized protein n=1 Tax=Saltatorellus ferox TaxID=2528018 RepID=A0A518EZA0_9BACT|nr:hypothetical protein Poly30_49650 [Planctomycetes bacterium Poly30]
MTLSFFDEDKRFCPECAGYVRFLQSPSAAYCAECGNEVMLFSPAEMKNLRRDIKGDSGDSEYRQIHRESAG